MSSNGDRDKVEEIKSRLDIVDVIGRDISLHKESNGMYAGATSPTSKSGASLKVDQKLQVFKNFATGEGGDVLDWIGYHAGYRDTRGSDFPDVLKTAADLAGVELEEATEAEMEAAKEKACIQNLFTEAAEIYHNNIKPEHYDYIKEKWGITKETVDNLKIGYATTGRDLKDLDKTTLKKSGLVYVNGGMTGGEVFTGRIVFPYWKNGKVVYLIGRQTEETPLQKDGKEPSKYQKLLVHSDKFPYVSPLVQNSYFYEEDSLRGADYCIITEGVADCIAMRQTGFSCISPVTVQFREKDHLKLISLTKKLNLVYICNDNEGNEAGLKGALSTAEALEEAGIEARLIILPKPECLDKIDIADYMKDHSQEDFKELIESSVRLWTYKLNHQVIPASSTSLERIRAFKNFILNDLRGMNSEEWTVFVNNEVPAKFRLNKKDIKMTVDAAIREWFKRENDAQTQTLEDSEAKTETDERLNEYPGRIKELAYTILKEGDAFDFMRETWNLRHVGDTNLGENCLCSIGSTFILNSDMGLHIKPSGESGKGKSDAMKEATLLLPAHKCISGSLSGKALFYDKTLKPGTIIYSDDAHLNDDIIATIKQSTSCFQEVTKHRTVVNGELKVFDIPERVVFWFSSVDGISDEQLANRFLNADVDCSSTQDERVHNHINEKEALAYSPIDDDILICRCIFDILDKERYVIKIPFTRAIDWRNKENRRNYQKFLDIIRAVAFFHVFQRRKVNGVYLADIEDFDRAVSIYTGTSKNNATNLTAREIEVLKFIADKNKYDTVGKPITENSVTKQDIMKKFNISSGRAHHILHGKDGKGGMLAKVAQLHKVEKSITTGGKPEDDKETTRANEYVFTGKELGLELYDTVASIDKKRVPGVEEEFIKTLLEETVTHCYPTITLDKVTVKTRTEERIKHNVTLKSKNETDTKILHTSKQSKEKVYAKNKSLSQNETEGNSSKEKCQPDTKTTVTHEGNNGVTEGNSCNTTSNDTDNKSNSSQDNENIYEVVGLLKRALPNYAKNRYKKAVNDLTDFVNCFNKDVPTYILRLNDKIVFDTAEQLHEWGRI